MIIALLVALGVSLRVVVVLVGSSQLAVIEVIRIAAGPPGAREFRRAGERPVIVELALAGGDTVALALRAEHTALALRRSAPLAG